MTKLFSGRSRKDLSECKVLVCSMDSSFRESLEIDKSVYLRHYRAVESIFFSSTRDLLIAIGAGYDIVHLFGSLSPSGLLDEARDLILPGSELLMKCCERDVKLLWIASENNPKDYVTSFNVTGKSLNVVMTISRNGAKFVEFLENVLSRTSEGETLPAAWAALVPQAEGPWQHELPSCIFYAGRGDVKLPSRQS
jgi:hypothetical protein